MGYIIDLKCLKYLDIHNIFVGVCVHIILNLVLLGSYCSSTKIETPEQVRNLEPILQFLPLICQVFIY